MRIVWGCCRLFDLIYLTQLLYYFAIKWSALMTIDPRWYAIGVEPCVYQRFGNHFSLLVGCEHCLCKIGKCIHHVKDILLSTSVWVQGGKIQTKQASNNGSLFDIRIYVGTFNFLATFAQLYPNGYILAHHAPIKLFSYKRQFTLSPLMTILIVKQLYNLGPVFYWYN